MEGKDIWVQKFLKGESVIQIAKEYSVTREAVYLRLRTLPNWRELSDSMREAKRGLSLRSYTSKQKKTILELAQKKYPLYKIAEKTGIPYKHVRILLKDTLYGRNVVAFRERNVKIRKEFEQGMTCGELAKKYGMSHGNMWKVINYKLACDN